MALSFDDYLEIGEVEQVSSDPGTARALIEDAEGRLRFIRPVVEAFPINGDNSKYIFENNYDVIRSCAECLMKADGYNSQGADTHVIAVAFIRDKYSEFTGRLAESFSRYRKMRNDSRYRANYVTIEAARESCTIAEEYARITRAIYNSKFP